MTKKIAVVVGSLRKESFNRKMANVLIALAPPSLSLHIVEIAALTSYNQDLDETPPAVWVQFRDQIKSSDGVLFVTPEYNRSVPGVLKNAIDIGSRPYGKSVWQGKPCAVISVAMGAIGGFGANHHLRQSAVFLDMPMMQQPEAYIGQAATLFDANGAITNPDTKKFVQQFIDAYAKWVTQIACR
jgi:chromate reductase